MNYNGQKPKFKSDYTSERRYIFLGNYTRDDNVEFDLYFYENEGMQTLIGKHGDKDSEYSSGLSFATPDSLHFELYEARLRAEALGINVRIIKINNYGIY